MDLHTPSKWTFWLSIILVVLALIFRLGHIDPVTQYAGWVGLAGYIILVIGCVFKTA